MRNILFVLIAAIATAACSSKSQVIYTADTMFGGNDIGAHVELGLDNFDTQHQEGTGSISVKKKAGSAWSGNEGAYPVTWKRIGQIGNILVTVNGAYDSFILEMNPIEASLPSLSENKSFWCQSCEQVRNGGFGVLPGLFVKK